MSDQSNIVQAPTEGAIYARDNVVAAERCEVPDSWKGRWVTFASFTTDTVVLFGDGSVTATLATRSTRTVEALAANDAVGKTIPAGQERSFFVPKSRNDAAGLNADITHFSHIAASATGWWEAQADGDV